jgi:hypothetical protein
MSTSSATMPPQAPTTSEAPQPTQYRLPTDITLKHCAKLAILEDKPMLLDYWSSSLDKKALIGVKESGEKLLVKSEEEYTSPIQKFYKSANEYIIITENSIYVVCSEIPNRRIS